MPEPLTDAELAKLAEQHQGCAEAAYDCQTARVVAALQACRETCRRDAHTLTAISEALAGYVPPSVRAATYAFKCGHCGAAIGQPCFDDCWSMKGGPDQVALRRAVFN